MRYYSNDYRTTIISEVIRAEYSVAEPKYAGSILNVGANNNVSNDASVKECLAAAFDAQLSISKVREKLKILNYNLEAFYLSVDKTANSICSTANAINELIDCANITLQNLDDAINGVGKYQGCPVTSQSINQAGALALFIRSKKDAAWDNIVCNLSNGGSPNRDIVIYLAKRLIQKLSNGEQITRNERSNIDTLALRITQMVKDGGLACRVRYLPALNELYKYYRLNRHDSCGDVISMPEEPLKACVSIYELLNPRAAQIINSFFEPAMKASKYDPKIVASNIEIIKYDLYTAGVRERQLVLSFLPYLNLMTLGGDETAKYDHLSCTLWLNMGKDCREEGDLDCGFFHEFGHGLDDLLLENEENAAGRIYYYVSNKYYSDVIDDFYEDLDVAMDNLGYEVSDDTRMSIYNFIATRKNVNVSLPDDHDYYKELMSGGKTEKKAYNDLREYFGYRDYIFDEAGSTFTVKLNDGIIDTSDETAVAGDLFGAITNDKLGSIGASHAINPGDPDQPEIKSAKDLKKYLTNESYWVKRGRFRKQNILPFIKINTTDGEAMCTEFFANSFSDRIHGVDQTRNKKLFPTAINDFENTLDETLADVYGDPQ